MCPIFDDSQIILQDIKKSFRELSLMQNIFEFHLPYYEILQNHASIHTTDDPPLTQHLGG